MTTVYITFRDTDDELVDVETIVHGGNPSSNAQALAFRVNEYLAEIAEQRQTPDNGQIEQNIGNIGGGVDLSHLASVSAAGVGA